jgi:hypothetical protein
VGEYDAREDLLQAVGGGGGLRASAVETVLEGEKRLTYGVTVRDRAVVY